MQEKSKILFNAGSQIMGKILTMITSLIIVKIVASYGADFYGDYVTAYEFLAFFGIIADAGLFSIAVREMSRDPKNTQKILGNLLFLRLILIFFVTILAGILAQFIPSYNEMVRSGIWITGLSMAMTIIAGTLSSILQSRMKIHFFSLSLVLGKIILMGIVWWLSVQNIEFSRENLVELFFNFLWAGAFSNLIFLLLVVYFVQKEVIIHLKFQWEYCKKIIKTALPYGISLVLQTLYLRLDIVLISILLGSTATGIYAISGRIMESLLIIGVFFGQAILPKLSAIDDKKLSPEKNKQDKNLVLSWGIEKLFLLAMPIIIGGLFFAKDIILLLSSADFTSEELMIGADSLLQILLPIIILAFLNQLFSFALVGKNLQGKLLPINLTAMSLNLILNLIYLPIYGILAAAWSTVLCEIIVFVWLLVIIKNNFKFIFSWEKWWRMILFNLIILAEILLTDLQENFKIAVVVCGLTYVLLVFWQRAKMFEMIQK